jgi:hypothetical protein
MHCRGPFKRPRLARARVAQRVRELATPRGAGRHASESTATPGRMRTDRPATAIVRVRIRSLLKSGRTTAPAREQWPGWSEAGEGVGVPVGGKKSRRRARSCHTSASRRPFFLGPHNFLERRQLPGCALRSHEGRRMFPAPVTVNEG